MTSKDTEIHKEMHRLALFVMNARQEVAAILNARDSAGAEKNLTHISAELNEIVRHTEEATNKIMDQAEAMIKLSGTAGDKALGAKVGDAGVKIMEACSFQDITGQRVKKILQIVEQVEKRVDRLVDLFGGDLETASTSSLTTGRERPDEALMAGPQMAGEGVNQADVDKLLSST